MIIVLPNPAGAGRPDVRCRAVQAWCALVVALLIAAFAPAGAAQQVTKEGVLKTEERLKALDAATETISVASSDEVFDGLRAELDEQRARAVRCVSEAEAALERLKKERSILVPAKEAPVPAQEQPPPGEGAAPQGQAAPARDAAAAESAALDKRRQTLKTETAELEERLALCRLLTLRAEELLDQVNKVEQQKLAQRLLARGPNIFEVVYANLYNPREWGPLLVEFMRSASGADDLGVRELVGLAVLCALAFAAGALIRRRVPLRPPAETGPTTTLSRLWWSFKACSLRFAPVVLVLVVASVFLTIHAVATGGEIPFINYLAYGLLAFTVVLRLTRVVLQPCPPAGRVFELPPEVAFPLSQRLKVLWAVMLVGGLLFYTPLEKAFHQDAYLLARDIYVGFIVANTIWVTWLAGRLEFLRSHWMIRALIVLAFLAILGAELLGYRNLAGTLVRSALQTLFALGGLFVLLKIVEEAFDALDEGHGGVPAAIRKGLGLGPGEFVPGLGWLRLTAIFVLWLALLALLLGIWGLSDDGFRVIYRYVAEGFEIGTFRVVPGQLLGAVVVFAVLLALSRWLKGQLDRRWLAKVRMDRGAKEALVTTSGYVGVAVAVLVGLSTAGLELTNLALIAGALSVGIGFGLQNVVNNFVSGLILLMERPIRTGDWIVVGSTQGYVKRISIRSTRIQTFDRADVIVPNSEIISNQVTNWMLTDPYGRLKLSLGVAYGSDVKKVEKVLLDAAYEHPLVVHGIIGLMEPKVMFTGFGDSSLDFELWCMLREVDMQLTVKSDLYFTIERRFREEGIEIPFPQRDLHVRTWSPPPQDPPLA